LQIEGPEVADLHSIRQFAPGCLPFDISLFEAKNRLRIVDASALALWLNGAGLNAHFLTP
jgi:hypothetical protein